MLYHLLFPLAEEFGAFNVVRYITFRTAAAALTALFISFLLGPDSDLHHPLQSGCCMSYTLM